MYAVGRPHPYKDVCARLAAELVRGEHEANIDSELLQEILYRFWRQKRVAQGFALFDAVATGFPDPLPVTGPDAVLARRLLQDHPLVAPRDAIHAAVVITNNLEGIISTDGEFGSIPGVTRFDPKDL